MQVSLLMCVLTVAQPGAEPPVAGRPRDWTGLSGGPFAITAAAEPIELKAEDQLTLTVRVTVIPGGSAGNLRTLSRPPLAKLEAFRVFAVEELDDGYTDNPPRREFRYRIRPRSDVVKEIPRIKLVYFNPRLPPGRGYQTTYSEEIPLSVRARTAARSVMEPIGDAPEWLGERPSADEILGHGGGPVARGIDAVLGKLGLQADVAKWTGGVGPLVGLMLLVPPAACAGWFVLWRRRNPTAARLAQVRRSRAAAAALRHLRTAWDDPAHQVAVVVLGYLRDRLAVPPGTATPADVATALSGHGDDELAVRTVALLRTCDEARFARSAAAAGELTTAAEKLILDWEAQPWPSSPS